MTDIPRYRHNTSLGESSTNSRLAPRSLILRGGSLPRSACRIRAAARTVGILSPGPAQTIVARPVGLDESTPHTITSLWVKYESQAI